MDRRGFFKSMLGKGLHHGARQVDAVILPFERAARAARDAIPADERADAAAAPAAAQETAVEVVVSDPPPALPAPPVARPCSDEDLMRVVADAGLVLHVEAAVALARRGVRIVPGDGPPPSGARSRFGGAPDLPYGEVWPSWDEEPLTFVAQLDLAAATAAGIDPLLPAEGLLLIFSALDRSPSGTSPLDAGSARLLWVAPDRVPPVAPEPVGPCQPAEPVALDLSSELVLPRVWTEQVQRLGLDMEQQDAWEQARRQIAELQGVTAWEAGSQLHALHRLLGVADDSGGDMPIALELASRGVDVGYAPPSAHPEAKRLGDAPQRWRLLLQLTVDARLGWSFGGSRKRLYVWGVEEEVSAGSLASVRAIAR